MRRICLIKVFNVIAGDDQVVKQAIPLIVALFLPWAAQATQCNSTSQFELVKCGGENVQVSSKLLNATYNKVKSQIPRDEGALLKEAQRTWVKFRSESCKKAALAEAGGREAVLASMACEAKESRLRTEELKYLIGESKAYGFYAYLRISQYRLDISFDQSIDRLASEVHELDDLNWQKSVEQICQIGYRLTGRDVRTCYARHAFYGYG